MMQVIFMADLSHDDPDSTIILIDGVIKGTGSKLPFRDPITVKPEGLVTVRYPISLIVGPVVGEEGKVLKGESSSLTSFIGRIKRRQSSSSGQERRSNSRTRCERSG